MFYERYLQLCEESKIAPSAAATKAGFNRGTVSVWKKKYEAGMDVTPEQDVIKKICDFFGCAESWLRGISEQKEKPTLVSEGGPKRNVLRLAGRDGSFVERSLTDEQVAAIKMMIEQLPDADDL